MNTTDKRIIDAIVNKAQAKCPGSLALIGVYGSKATGDTHERSDLDLLMLINDEKGRCLASGFILDDTGIGYDIYCTDWAMLERDAKCTHAQLAKLLDSRIVWADDDLSLQSLEKLRCSARELLASKERQDRAMGCFEKAKAMYADCFLAESLSLARVFAAAAVLHSFDALMLSCGRYFAKGTKRMFEELAELSLPFDVRTMAMAVVTAETEEALRLSLSALMKAVKSHLSRQGKERELFVHHEGTYEEMVSNWKNKMVEAAQSEDMFSSFMNMAFFQFMLDVTASPSLDIMANYDPQDANKNREAFDLVLDAYLEQCREAGVYPKHFANVDDFAAHYAD